MHLAAHTVTLMGTGFAPTSACQNQRRDNNMYEEMNQHFADQMIGEEDFDADGYGDGSVQATQDGCHVEPDGKCPHGYMSPQMRLLF